jgi:probable F420-dependent oxidoreductase
VPLILAARETTRLTLTTGIAVAFARNPMSCAYLANDLQLVSEGRFVLGLGTQIKPHIERRFSEPWSQPNARMHEFVRALRAIWHAWASGERLAFEGAFYRHTLMTPFFNPGRNPFGAPPVLLAGFGPAMVRVAGEVADGWIVHPLHSPSFVEAVALPALRAGLAAAGRGRAAYTISCQTITMIGRTDEQVAHARAKARMQIAFYASTPAYRPLLEHHGWEHLQPELHRMTREGRWDEMAARVSDEMLDAIGVSGTPAAVARRLGERHAFADRVTMVLYNEADPEAGGEVVRALRGG